MVLSGDSYVEVEADLTTQSLWFKNKSETATPTPFHTSQMVRISVSSDTCVGLLIACLNGNKKIAHPHLKRLKVGIALSCMQNTHTTLLWRIQSASIPSSSFLNRWKPTLLHNHNSQILHTALTHIISNNYTILYCTFPPDRFTAKFSTISITISSTD